MLQRSERHNAFFRGRLEADAVSARMGFDERQIEELKRTIQARHGEETAGAMDKTGDSIGLPTKGLSSA
jgi:hypothetical protein